MRLFTAIDIPERVRSRLREAVDQLRPHAAIAWSPEANWHITTKFLGEFPESRLPELTAALSKVEGVGQLPLSLRVLGWFPNPHRPRVLFAGLHSPLPEGLARLRFLHQRTDDACATVGVPTEGKPFSPHLTLARIREEIRVDQLRKAIAELPSVDFGDFTATSQFLYCSQPGPDSSVYRKLTEFSIL